ncbi:hypothetical protein [Thiolapillus brandeum]|nr:hypothetical protein [Thiolapillus brandeum]
MAEITVETGRNTGLRTWKWSHHGVSLRLVQRLPDQTRAYVMGKGFPRDAADELATSCFFGSMFRNDGKLPMDFDLREWKVVQNGKKNGMKVRETWKQRYRERDDISDSARIGLNWSLMPTVQHFEPGDYNWGMTVYGLPPGEKFDLHLKVVLDGKPLEAVIPGLQCAPETVEKPVS